MGIDRSQGEPEQAGRQLAADTRDEVDVLVADDVRRRYARDESPFRVMPAAVARPQNAEQVARVVSAAARLGLPVTARAGGSSVAGQSIGAGVVVDTSALDSIEVESDTVFCGPGAILDDVNTALARHGRQIGPEATSRAVARIGGLVGTNAAGAHSRIQGRFGDVVEAVELVTAHGERLHLGRGDMPDFLAGPLGGVRDALDPLPPAWPRLHRTYGGYRLDAFAAQGDALSLIPGSEGTLGLTTATRLRTVARTSRGALDVHGYSSVEDALAAAAELAADAQAVELLDSHLLEAARSAGLSARAPQGARAVLLVERSRSTKPPGSVVRLEGEQAEAAWRLRTDTLPLLRQRGVVPISLFEDPAVAPERLGELASVLRDILAACDLRPVLYGHVAAGLLHVRPLVDPRDPYTRARLERALGEVAGAVVDLGGALTGEHGFGLARSHLVDRLLGPDLAVAFERIKLAFDPHRLLNPGLIAGGSDPFSLFAPVR